MIQSVIFNDELISYMFRSYETLYKSRRKSLVGFAGRAPLEVPHEIHYDCSPKMQHLMLDEYEYQTN